MEACSLLHGTAASLPSALAATQENPRRPRAAVDFSNTQNAHSLLADGRQIFRYDTFGDDDFWGGTLKLHLAIAGTNNGGVGPGVSPKTGLHVAKLL